MLFPPFEAWDKPPAEWIARAMERRPERRQAGVIGQVSIANLRFTKPGPGDIRCDRASEAILGNPFLTRGEVARDDVCDACDEVMACAAPDATERAARSRNLLVAEGYGGGEMSARRGEAVEAIVSRLTAGESVRLLCWCYPRRCHVEGIARIARQRAAARMADERPKKRRK